MASKTEVILVARAAVGARDYRPVQSQRTEENFFRIVSKRPSGESWEFETGDVVRGCWRYFGDSGGVVAVAPASAELPIFKLGQRVLVSRHAGWKSDCFGAIAAGPEATTTLLGPDNLWWVEFDTPQEDFDGGEHYVKAQILGSYLHGA